MELNKKAYWSRQGFKFLEQHSVVIDQVQQSLLWLIVVSILLWGVIGLNRPISTVQQQELVHYQTQYLYSHTHELSRQLLAQEQSISQLQYYRFLRILNYEQKRIQYQKDLDAK